MGMPRKYRSHAARQAAYAKRQRDELLRLREQVAAMNKEQPMYKMEPIADETCWAEWMIELEIGRGVGQNMVLVTDLRESVKLPLSDHTVLVSAADGINRGGKHQGGLPQLTIPLTPEEVEELRADPVEFASNIALAILGAEEPHQAKPTDRVRFVFFEGLTAKTAHLPPKYQHCFRYVETEEEEEAKLPD
jgi:hypothetical protein